MLLASNVWLQNHSCPSYQVRFANDAYVYNRYDSYCIWLCLHYSNIISCPQQNTLIFVYSYISSLLKLPAFNSLDIIFELWWIFIFDKFGVTISQITICNWSHNIISDVVQWRRCQALLRLKLQEKIVLEKEGDPNLSSDEVRPIEFKIRIITNCYI